MLAFASYAAFLLTQIAKMVKKVANSHLRVIYMLNIPSSLSVKGKCKIL
jgi:hypothetical protein